MQETLTRTGQLSRQDDTIGNNISALASGSGPPKLAQEDGVYSNLLPVDRVRCV